GVRPFINCCSVRTMHGGSLMLPRVRAAVDAASRHFVNLAELMAAASKRIAELTGAEWGIVTCGSAAAVALGTAACVAGNDPIKMLRLPFTDGMVNRVIIPRKQRFAYDQAVRMIGCHIVEIDTREELDKALEEPVALVVLLGKQEHLTSVRLEEIASVVKPRGIPIMVDAASEHIEQPSPWLARGADLVIYSGGKFLRGPQTSGLLLGSKRLCQAAWGNGSPHQALGRPMKVSKEDIIGVVTALEYWIGERDTAAERQKWFDDCAAIAERFGQLDGVHGEVVDPEGVDRVPRLQIVWDRSRYPLNGLGLRQRARRPSALGSVRGAVSRRARRRHRALQLRCAIRGEQHVLPLRGSRQRRRDGRHRRARRRHRLECRHRQPHPVRQRRLAGPPPRVIRNGARLTILAAMLGVTPTVAGIVDTYECRRGLAMADQLVHGVRLRENSVKAGDFVGLCRLLRRNLDDMVKARGPMARCMTGHDQGENVAQMDASIGDIRYVLARHCQGR